MRWFTKRVSSLTLILNDKGREIGVTNQYENGVLAAAAPEMYEILKEVRDALEQESFSGPVLQAKVIDAIARAEGRITTALPQPRPTIETFDCRGCGFTLPTTVQECPNCGVNQ